MQARTPQIDGAPNYPARLFAEHGMRFEILWRFEFGAEDFARAVGVFLAAVVAADGQVFVQRRRRHDGVGFAERNGVSEVEIVTLVEAVILTENNPEIFGSICHARPPIAAWKR